LCNNSSACWKSNKSLHLIRNALINCRVTRIHATILSIVLTSSKHNVPQWREVRTHLGPLSWRLSTAGLVIGTNSSQLAQLGRTFTPLLPIQI
jgi:hypothetical protein